MPRSPQLMSCHDTALLVIDVQEKLVRLVPDHRRIVWNIGRLVAAARVLHIPVLASEQYPQGLGETIPEIASQLEARPSKLTFSCAGCPSLAEELERLASRGVHKILVAGLETHVCVQQTAMDLMADSFDVYLAVDAVGSRFEPDSRIAVDRMDSAGATVTTTEAALFEWCEKAGTSEFKQISALVRQEPPEG